MVKQKSIIINGMKTLFIYITMLLLATGCGTPESESCHKRITFFNNYHKDMYITSSGTYPDTMHVLKYPPGIVSQAFLLKTPSGQSNGSAIEEFAKGCIEYYFQNRDNRDTVMFFVFDADVLENESSQTIKDNYLVLQRYDLSLDDVRQLEWMLPFPPTEKMKYMRMYPPYGTYNK
jgi:hypothetical protein